jgi:hypothetical protein
MFHASGFTDSCGNFLLCVLMVYFLNLALLCLHSYTVLGICCKVLMLRVDLLQLQSRREHSGCWRWR